MKKRRILCLLLTGLLCLSAAPGFAATLTLPSGLKVIEEEAFLGNTSLDEVVLPEGLQSIGRKAFAKSSVKVVHLPNSINIIEQGAFENCEISYVVAEEDSYSYTWAKEAGISIKPETTSEDSFDYKSTSKGITIVEYIGYEQDVVIPEKINGKKVVAIDDGAFYSAYNVRSVWIPSTVSSIGEYVFDFAYKLEEIQIYGVGSKYYSRDGVLFSEADNSLKYYPRGKDDIISYSVPDGIQKIERGAFYCNEFLKRVVLPDSIREIGESAFLGCEKLQNINIPYGIKKLNDGVFGSCAITQIDIPDSVTVIGNNVFSNCKSLKSIVIPSSVTQLGVFTFSYCSDLLGIEIPSSVKKIGEYAFIGSRDDFVIYGKASSYTETYANEYDLSFINGKMDLEELPEEITDFIYEIELGRVVITGYTGNETEVVIPEKLGGFSVGEIGPSAFEGYSDLVRIELPDSVTSIDSGAFKGCNSLISINIPNKLTYIGSSAFYGCSSLTSISIPETVYTIGDSAFRACSSLNSIVLPEIMDIYMYTFMDCTSLTKVVISDSEYDINIGTSAFSNCQSLTSITIPESVTSIDSYAFSGCESLKHISIPDSVTSIAAGTFAGCNSLTNISFSNSVANIGNYAFTGCSSLRGITIPNSVIGIGDGAFKNCSGLLNITIPDSITQIGSYTFEDCSSLLSVSIPDSVTSIGDDAFRGCSSLASVTLTDSVRSLGSSVFTGCYNLLGIEIPSSVTSIGNFAFYACNSLTIYGTSGSYAETYAVENYIPFVAGKMSSPFATLSGFTLNSAPIELTVPVGTSLAFSGTVTAAENTELVAVQASIFDASDLSKGVVFDRAENIGADTFDLSALDNIVVGQPYSDDKQTLTMEAGKSYDVMLYATNTNGCGFASIPTIRVNVTEAANDSITYSGISYGAEVEQEDFLVSWKPVSRAHCYYVAMRDLNTNIKLIDTPTNDQEYVIEAELLTPGHEYNLWIAALDDQENPIDGKNIRFKVCGDDLNVSEPVCIMDASELNVVLGKDIQLSGEVSAQSGELNTVWIVVEDMQSGEFCDYAIFDAEDMSSVTRFDLENVPAIPTGEGKSISTCDSEHASSLSTTLRLDSESSYKIIVYAQNTGMNARKEVASKQINLLCEEPLGEIAFDITNGELLEEASNITWNSVTGTAYYQFSMRDLTMGTMVENALIIDANGECIYTPELVSGHQYRIHIAAIPEGVEYPNVRCSETQVEFSYRRMPSDFSITELTSTNVVGEDITISWNVPRSADGCEIVPDNYAIYVYHNGEPVYQNESYADTSLRIDGAVFSENGVYNIAVYATKYLSWNDYSESSHSMATINYSLAEPKLIKVGSGTYKNSREGMDTVHWSRHTTFEDETLLFWAIASEETQEVYVEQNGIAMNGGLPLSRNADTGRFEIELPICEGLNKVSFSVYSSDGIESTLTDNYYAILYCEDKTMYALDGAKHMEAPYNYAGYETLGYGEPLTIRGSMGKWYYTNSHFILKEDVVEAIQTDIVSPRNNDIIDIYNGEDIVVTFAPCEEAEAADQYAYFISLIDVAISKEVRENILLYDEYIDKENCIVGDPYTILMTWVSPNEERRVEFSFEDEKIKKILGGDAMNEYNQLQIQVTAEWQ